MMKKTITLLGKSVIVILYWALVAFFVWLFYDEYIIEQQWSSICMCIAFFSLGCAPHGLFVNWLYKVELKQFEHKHQKTYDILGKIVSIASYVFIGIFIISFLVGLLGEFLFTLAYGVYLIACIFGKYWLVVALLFITCVILKAFKQPTIKVVSKFIYRLSLLSSIALVIYIEIISWINRIDAETFQGNCLIAGCVVLLFLFGVLCFLLYNSLERGVLSFAKHRYVLFLRAFKDDDSIQCIYDDISQSINDISFVKIGNPQKTEGENINEHWLPLSNWKFFLKFYISKAKAIVLVASSTGGVVWEMMQNMKYLNKCIIVFASLDELTEFKNKLSENGSCDTIIDSIEKVVQNCRKENAFVIQNDKIYMGNACSLVNYVLKNDFEGIRVISVTNINSTETRLKQKNLISSIGDFLFRHFHILNFVNMTESIHNNSLRGVIKGIAFIIGAAIYIAQLLMGVGLMLYPLVIWFGDKVDWLGICYGSVSITERVLMTLFSLGFGFVFIINLFEKD